MYLLMTFVSGWVVGNFLEISLKNYTSVGDFHCVSIDDFFEWVGCGKILVNKVKELYICRRPSLCNR